MRFTSTFPMDRFDKCVEEVLGGSVDPDELDVIELVVALEDELDIIIDDETLFGDFSVARVLSLAQAAFNGRSDK